LHAENSPVGHASINSDGGDSWEIVMHTDGSIFLVGPHKTTQINPALVDDLLNLRISPLRALEITAQASFSPIVETSASGEAHDGFDGALAAGVALGESLRASPSGLTTAEKEDAAVVGAAITRAIDEGEVLSTAQEKGKSKASTLYSGRYLDEYGGVEPGGDEPYVMTELSDTFEPLEIADEEMELEQDD
jgi:hypothetical protein